MRTKKSKDSTVNIQNTYIHLFLDIVPFTFDVNVVLINNLNREKEWHDYALDAFKELSMADQ